MNEHAHRENEELRRQLSVLKTTMYSFGARPDEQQTFPIPADIASSVTARALVMQDAGGRLNRHELVAYFLERGSDAREVEDAISSLCRAGAAKEDGSWLQLS